jgi:hypothetical protein
MQHFYCRKYKGSLQQNLPGISELETAVGELGQILYVRKVGMQFRISRMRMTRAFKSCSVGASVPGQIWVCFVPLAM